MSPEFVLAASTGSLVGVGLSLGELLLLSVELDYEELFMCSLIPTALHWDGPVFRLPAFWAFPPLVLL